MQRGRATEKVAEVVEQSWRRKIRNIVEEGEEDREEEEEGRRRKHKTILSGLRRKPKLDNEWGEGVAESPTTAKILNAILPLREEHTLLQKLTGMLQ